MEILEKDILQKLEVGFDNEDFTILTLYVCCISGVFNVLERLKEENCDENDIDQKLNNLIEFVSYMDDSFIELYGVDIFKYFENKYPDYIENITKLKNIIDFLIPEYRERFRVGKIEKIIKWFSDKKHKLSL